MEGREGKRESRELKVEREKGKCVLAFISIYMFHEDESRCVMDAMLHHVRGHFKFTYQKV